MQRPTLVVIFLLALAPVARAQDCFAGDQGAASTNRDGHYRWAERRDAAALETALKSKLGLLFQCPSRNDDQLATSFAGISVVIASYVPNVACFQGDTGVVSMDWSKHRAWARARNRKGMLDGLQWKSVAAYRCLPRDKQLAFYADISVAIARPPDPAEGNVTVTVTNRTSYRIVYKLDGDFKCELAAGANCNFMTAAGKHAYRIDRADSKFMQGDLALGASPQICIYLRDNGAEADKCDF
jgi:hypothetical protein